MSPTTKKAASKAAPKIAARVVEPASSDVVPVAPAGYVYVTRTVTTVDDPDDDRAPGYVHIAGQEESRLVDVKSVPELGVLGYRVVDAPKATGESGGGDGRGG